MFADLALPSRICPKTPGRHSLGVGGKSATILSKILLSSRYKTKAQPSTIIDQLPTAENWLDPEPGRTPAPRMGPVRFRGIQSIGNSANSSTKIWRNLALRSRRLFLGQQ